eukprot:CAMPEP_0177591408 /NCGR_PEP_ID=MMETSP0419_2-20121207/7981_1 /TAXON_ID=582737 /ORGANISM="Tetraselmis sp., Strain GSL018" /LENGTH=216 /DNA_ID=CAMNT_0019082147 /DNA_START=66 /DNA_END=717 /DNA_ORIENTATION=+
MAEDEEVYGTDINEQLEDMEEVKEAAPSGNVAGEGHGQGAENEEAQAARNTQMEEENAKLKEIQAKVQQDTGMATGDDMGQPSGEPGSREEADSRSVYVGNVDYSCTPEELQVHFQSCGTVNRVTILTDKFGQAKGYAYVEFLEGDAVDAALHLNGSELRGRQIKVSAKRTNVPGFKMLEEGAVEEEDGGTHMQEVECGTILVAGGVGVAGFTISA